MPGVTDIRRAGGADLAALLPLIREFCEADGHPYAEGRVVRGLAPLLDDDALGQVWLAEEPGGALGYAVVTWGWSLESGGREALLDEIFVRRRGDGVGGRLLREVMAGASAAGCSSAFLETEAPNDRARAFYARHGFAREDSVWMHAELPLD